MSRKHIYWFLSLDELLFYMNGQKIRECIYYKMLVTLDGSHFNLENWIATRKHISLHVK